MHVDEGAVASGNGKDVLTQPAASGSSGEPTSSAFEFWRGPPTTLPQAIARVSRLMDWIVEWRHVAECVRDAEKASAVDASGVERARDESRNCLSQWCPAEGAAAIRGTDDGSAMATFLGPHVFRLADRLYVADRLWPHRHPAHDHPKEGPTAWPATNQQVASDLAEVVAVLEEACQEGAFLILAYRARDRRVGVRTAVVSELAQWNLTEAHASSIIQWMKADPPHFGGECVPYVVDTDTRSIYRSAMTFWEKSYTTTAWLWGSALGLTALIALFALLDAADLTTPPGDWFVKLLVLYLFVIGGAVTHIASMQLSAIRFDDSLQIYAAASGLDWLRLRWLAVLRLLIPVVVVAGSLWGAGNIPADFEDLGVALLAGYSADSLFRAGINKIQMQASSAAGSQSPAATSAVTR
jgi:hypothetical protein